MGLKLFKLMLKGLCVGCLPLQWRLEPTSVVLESLNVVRNDKRCCRGGERIQNHIVTTSKDPVKMSILPHPSSPAAPSHGGDSAVLSYLFPLCLSQTSKPETFT